MKRLTIIILFFTGLLSVSAQQGSGAFFERWEFIIEPQRFNTVASDISPLFIGNKLFYSSVREKYFNNESRERKNKAFYDIYELMLDEKGIVTSDRRLVEGFGGEFHEGPAAWCEATSELFVTLSNIIHPDTIPGFIPTEHKKLRLAIKKFNGKTWELTEELPFNDDKYHFAHPAISVTGDTLVFTSDMPAGNYGNNDLYMSVRKEGKWSDPVNLGRQINTPGHEMFPTFGPDGTLLFSSDGHPGNFGQLDIYYTTFPSIGTIRNIGNKINSTHDDFGLVIHPNRETGYFASDRPGRGSDDIYRIDIRKTLQMLVGRVVDDSNGVPVPNATVQLLDCDRKQIAVAASGADGGFRFEVSPNLCYFVQASAESYEEDIKNATGLDFVELRLKRRFNYNLVVMEYGTTLPVDNATVTCSGEFSVRTNAQGVSKPPLKSDAVCELLIHKEGYLDKTFFPDISKFTGTSHTDTVWLLKPELGRAYVLRNIYYNFDKWDIRSDARPSLDNLVAILKEYPISIELSSHTDSRGTFRYNEVLSQRRAESAVAYIISQGIDPGRITARGYGESMPVNHCVDNVPCTEEMHQANRRTEFRITAIQEGARTTRVDQASDEIVIGASRIAVASKPGSVVTTVDTRPAAITASETPETVSKSVTEIPPATAQEKPVDKTSPAQTDIKDTIAGDTFYSVQIMAGGSSVINNTAAFKGVGDVFEKLIPPYYKYYSGKFSSYAEALSQRNKIQNLFPGCFVVAFKEGSVVPVDELRRLLGK